MYWSFFKEIDKKTCDLWQIRCFSHQIEPYTAALNFSAVLKHFYRNWQKKLVFLSKKCFSQYIEPHTCVFLIKMSKIQLNGTFLLYCRLFTEIDKKLSFWTKKYFSRQIEALHSYTKVFWYFEAFLQKLTKTFSFRSKNVFLNKLNTYRSFSHQNEQNKAKRSLFVVLKFFYRNWQKTCDLCQKGVFLIILSLKLLC